MAFQLRTIGFDNSPGSTEIEVGDLLTIQIMCRTSDSITVDSVSDDQGNTWVQAGRHAANGQFCEIWWAICETKANTIITPVYSATPTQPFVEWAGWIPDGEFEVGDTNGSNQTSTSHPCGEVDIPADSLALTATSLSTAFSATPHTDYTELVKGTRGYTQYRLTTEEVLAADGAWTSGSSEEATNLHVVFQPVSGGGGADPTRGRLSFAEFEVPLISTRGRLSFAEFEVPLLLTRGRLSFAEFEVPTVVTRGRLSFSTMEVPSLPTSGRVSWFEFEVPEVGAAVVARFRRHIMGRRGWVRQGNRG